MMMIVSTKELESFREPKENESPVGKTSRPFRCSLTYILPSTLEWCFRIYLQSGTSSTILYTTVVYIFFVIDGVFSFVGGIEWLVGE